MSLTVAEAIANRRATRKYTEQEVSDVVLDAVVSQALQAPSAFNAQRADLVVVRDQAIKDKIFEASGQKQLRDAPVVLITVARADVPEDLDEVLGAERATFVRNVLADADAAHLRETALKDAMLVAGFALIAAQGEGLATSPTTGWDEAKILAAIGLADRSDRAVGLVIGMGYPAEFPAHPGRAESRRVDNGYVRG
ncbi:dehydrogenase [Corynebacterium pseudotuberculosis]|uniref:nitroreductase family protein n=1 Tax=Corynebacterium pseudotuberculosis TaxID=1719 RepID=UPI000737BD06|nr:nitroreductase family protein [Corynebacterium pseudotuberculosis]ALU20691.1 dehydrogenase [Corynebacterium pseudotuberculosis]ANH22860.1 NADH dehydrogenase [Corynebacterium pseudotuberculosis]